MTPSIAAWLLALAPPVEVQRPHDGPPTLALAWSAPAGDVCPSRAAVIERIAAVGLRERIGEWIPTEHASAELGVAVTIEPRADRWQATLSLRDAEGRSQRTFEANGCEALADATALIVAVTLDPVAVGTTLASGRAPEPAPQPEPAPPPEPEPEPLPEPEPQPQPEPLPEPDTSVTLPSDEASPPQRWPDDLHVGLSLHGGGSWGPTPALHGALGGRVALLGRRWRAALGGRWSTPRQVTRTAAAGSFDGWAIEALGCFVPHPGPVELPLCGGVELGRVRGRGLVPTLNPTTERFLWVAPTLSQGLSWAPIERFAIGVEIGLVVPLTRGSFVVGSAELERLAVVGGRALVSLELRLP